MTERAGRTIRGRGVIGAVLVALLIPLGSARAVAAVPSVPAGLRVARNSAGSVTLRWKPSPGAVTYRVVRNGALRARGLLSTRFADGAVSRFRAYSYAVVACNPLGCSRRTPATTAVTPGGACAGAKLTPASNLQRAIDARAGGTTFCLAPGTYHVRSPIIPKSGDVLWGAPGAVLTGDRTTSRALVGYLKYQRHVTVAGLTIVHFAGGDGAVSCGNGWIVEGNRIAFNGGYGVRAQSGSIVRGNYIHHSGSYGIAGALDMSGVTFSRNVVAFNDTKRGEGGGAKILRARYARFLGNYVHDNWGSGLYCDTDCIHLVFAGNRVTGNRGIGIFLERGFASVIRNNVVAGNDREVAGKSVYWGSQIHLNDSQGVEIYGNLVVASVKGTNGIGLLDYARGSGPYGTYRIANDYIHDNVVFMRGSGMTGMVDGPHGPARLDNRFRHNRYRVSPVGGAHFAWLKYPIGWRRWRSSGQDASGTIRRW